jgi:hypothetical protein
VDAPHVFIPRRKEEIRDQVHLITQKQNQRQSSSSPQLTAYRKHNVKSNLALFPHEFKRLFEEERYNHCEEA